MIFLSSDVGHDLVVDHKTTVIAAANAPSANEGTEGFPPSVLAAAVHVQESGMSYEPVAWAKNLAGEDASLGPAQITRGEAKRYWGYVPDRYAPDVAIGLLGAKIGATNKAYSDNCGTGCNSTDRMVSLFLGQNGGPDAVSGYARSHWDWSGILRNDDQATRNTSPTGIGSARTWLGYRAPYPIGWDGRGNMRHQLRRMLDELHNLNWNDLPGNTDIGYIQCLANGGNCPQ